MIGQTQADTSRCPDPREAIFGSLTVTVSPGPPLLLTYTRHGRYRSPHRPTHARQNLHSNSTGPLEPAAPFEGLSHGIVGSPPVTRRENRQRSGLSHPVIGRGQSEASTVRCTGFTGPGTGRFRGVLPAPSTGPPGHHNQATTKTSHGRSRRLGDRDGLGVRHTRPPGGGGGLGDAGAADRTCTTHQATQCHGCDARPRALRGGRTGLVGAPRPPRPRPAGPGRDGGDRCRGRVVRPRRPGCPGQAGEDRPPDPGRDPPHPPAATDTTRPTAGTRSRRTNHPPTDTSDEPDIPSNGACLARC